MIRNEEHDDTFPEDDVNVSEADEPELEDVEEQANDAVKQLKRKLKECQAEKHEQLEELQKSRADFLNSKKRMEEQLVRDTERVTNTCMERLLPLCDSFDQAMADKDAWERCDESWRRGIEAIHEQLLSILQSYSVERIGTVGEIFDPNQHEAVSVKEETGQKPDTVLEVMQSGYIRNGQLLRPAKVIINSS